MIAQVGNISWSEYVSQHLLPRIFGFELLMAPYAIAHLTLGLFLEETGYQFDSGKRLGVFLTNTLDDPKTQSEYLFQGFIADGVPLGEKNPKWLQDDYVKFIRFSQWRITKTGLGILAFITNHGYLDNPTFRGMRRSIEKTFDEIYVMDLHGNSKKKETAPDGSKDENVFDIQQGVAIGMMVKLG